MGQFNQGDVYRTSVFNYCIQSDTSTNLSTTSGVSLQVIKGGSVIDRVASGGGLGSIVSGGTTVTTLTPPTGQAGNTWRAVEISPATGQVNKINQIVNSSSSATVR